MAQPYIYDVTASLASGGKVTYALALLMTMNYVAIVVSPFIMEYIQKFIGAESEDAPFMINAVIALVAFVFILWRAVTKKKMNK